MERVEATDYRELAQVGDPQLSPDGSRVAFVHTVPADEESYESTVRVVPATGDGEPRQFTAGPHDDRPRWSPSGDRLAFVRRGEDDDAAQLYVLPTDGGEARQVTAVAGGVEHVAWSPDGTRVAFTQPSTPAERGAGHDLAAPDDYEREEPDPRVVDRLVYRAHERYLGDARSHVYVVDLATDAVERVTSGEYDHRSPVWRDDRTLYYAVKRGPEPDDSVEFDVDAHDVETGERETVTTTCGWDVQLAASADGRLAYPYTPPERLSMRQTELEVYDPGTGETTRPTAEFDRTVDLRYAPFSWADGRVHFVAPDEGRFVVCRADPAGGVERVTDAGHATGVSAHPDRVAFTRGEWDHPGDVFVREGGETRRVTAVNESYLAERAVHEPEPVAFESGGEEIEGWLLVPGRVEPEQRFPLVVEVHGGPHAMWSTSGTTWHEFQTLAARGYAVLWTNPRGSTGYGEAFATAIERDWGRVTAADVLAGVEAACEHPAVDEREVHLTGGSFGGFMTAWLVGHTDRFRSAVTQRGVYDLTSFYGTTDAFKLLEGDFDATPWEEPAFLWEQSPAAHVEAVDTPTLVLHAENDFRVPVGQGDLLYRFLRKCGVETRLVRYPRDGHELSRSGEPAHVVDRIERIARWFDGYSDYFDVPKAIDRGADGLSGSEGPPTADADE